MSGFFGVLRPDGAAINQEWLAQLAAKLSFRGPDGTNVRAQDGWGCSFAFLQTDPGRHAPQQPVTLDGRFWLLGHVRLDARDALLRRLSGRPLPCTNCHGRRSTAPRLAAMGRSFP